MVAILKNLKLKAIGEIHNPQNDNQYAMDEKGENPKLVKENAKRYETTKNYFYFNQMIK